MLSGCHCKQKFSLKYIVCMSMSATSPSVCTAIPGPYQTWWMSLTSRLQSLKALKGLVLCGTLHNGAQLNRFLEGYTSSRQATRCLVRWLKVSKAKIESNQDSQPYSTFPLPSHGTSQQCYQEREASTTAHYHQFKPFHLQKCLAYGLLPDTSQECPMRNWNKHTWLSFKLSNTECWQNATLPKWLLILTQRLTGSKTSCSYHLTSQTCEIWQGW